MKLPKGALVAVVDGEKLVLFKNSGDADQPKLTAHPTPEIPERLSGAPGRQSSAANPDNDTQAEDGFAFGVAELLNKKALNGKFDHLVVIAAPKTLGALRKNWHKELESRLTGEIAKDLTNQTSDQIADAIAKA